MLFLLLSNRQRFNPNSWFVHLVARAVVLLSAAGLIGCGRAPTNASTDAVRPADAKSAPASSARPTQTDLETFLRASDSPDLVARLAVQTDAPVPYAQGGPGTWLLNAKLTWTLMSDLYVDATNEDLAPHNALIEERNQLIDWRNRFAQTRFARERYPNFRVGPGVPMPALIALKTPKGKVLPPVYVKFIAEWQVDRWHFAPLEGASLPDFASFGLPRSDFAADALIKGSPEEGASLEAKRKVVAEAKAKKVEIEATYQKMVTEATQPGNRYVGRITHPLGVVAAEARFLPRPEGQEDNAAFTVTLPNNPDYSLEFTGVLNQEVLIAADAADLTAHATKHSGKEGMGTVPGTMIRGIPGIYSGENKYFMFTGESLEGNVSAFNGRHHFSGTRVK